MGSVQTPHGSGDLAGRSAMVDLVLGDPPVVHYMSFDDLQRGQQSGVWSTDKLCYKFMAERCPPGSKTLETGSGVSTVLFAAWGAQHTCVTPTQGEVEGVLRYCREKNIPIDGLTFDIGDSTMELPKLPSSDRPLDLLFIDGGHAFPTPIIDWYYGAAHLRQGGTLVVDDAQLPAVRVLRGFLDSDPRWLRVANGAKWVAYQRESDEPLGEEWTSQLFYLGPPPMLSRLGSTEIRMRKALGHIRRAAIARLNHLTKESNRN